MTPFEREQVRLELGRAMRDDAGSVPALRLLDALEVDIEDPRPIDGLCSCGRLLEVGDGYLCGDCCRLGGLE